MIYLRYLLVILFCFFLQAGFAQKRKVSSSKSRENIRLEKVAKDMEEGKSDAVIAEEYEKLAKDFSANGDYAKAEDYFNKAKSLYEKIKDKAKIASVERELAKVQEAQNKVGEAIVSYDNAQKKTDDKTLRQININDRNRLTNQNNPQAQAVFIKQNINLLDKTDQKEDRVLAFRQMAEVNKEMDNAPAAIKNLETALLEVKDQPVKSLEIKQEIANAYIADNQMEKALEINKDLVEEAKKIENPKAEVKQLQNLSSNYIEANKREEGISVLKEAYDLAIGKGQTLEAKNTLELLVEQYKNQKQTQKALQVYADFVSKLEPLVRSDSTLIDEKFFQVQEEKIMRLEKERELKDALIVKTNRFNYILIVTVVLVLIFLLFIAKALYSIKKKNKKIALQSLRREMNPHFIFNSLNSVNQFIAQNNELEANKYLSSYSKLMRNIMENSNKDFIPLSVELEQMKEYLDLEYLRFHDKFRYIIEVDNSLDTDTIFIPNMLIQPQLENAIWHGLRYKEGRGLLSLLIREEKMILSVVIEDNGIGLSKSRELKTKHQRQHQSRGMTNTKERISLLNSLYDTNITIDVIEKTGNETGVIVTLQIPLMKKHR